MENYIKVFENEKIYSSKEIKNKVFFQGKIFIYGKKGQISIEKKHIFKINFLNFYWGEHLNFLFNAYLTNIYRKRKNKEKLLKDFNIKNYNISKKNLNDEDFEEFKKMYSENLKYMEENGNLEKIKLVGKEEKLNGV
ncbi:hypothetical protein MMJJ_02320 [Methanococcus maripaludis]|uniref:Uncharacterized protein n=1 Tax=Methanococcus maripaludis TaxID=39152 RepID=A0A2L1C8F2_METMI|nr:hypothetical protein MMJJ_02320 [Methanococcus maripaludis]